MIIGLEELSCAEWLRELRCSVWTREGSRAPYCGPVMHKGSLSNDGERLCTKAWRAQKRGNGLKSKESRFRLDLNGYLRKVVVDSLLEEFKDRFDRTLSNLIY